MTTPNKNFPTPGMILYSYMYQVLGEHGEGGLSPELRMGLIKQATRGLSVEQLLTVRHHVDLQLDAAHDHIAARVA